MINDEKYRELIAKQLGIEPSELIPIEQLAIVRPGPTWKDVYDYIISGNDAPGYLKVTKKWKNGIVAAGEKKMII